MKNIAVVFGTRPEAIKLVPVILELRKQPEIDVQIVLTGQHKEMLDQVMDLFELTPKVNFNVMNHNQNLGETSATIIKELYNYFENNKTDLVVVQGDTLSTFAGALTAFFHKIPIAYVEAGLRTGNLFSPWPEEANRLMTSQITDLYFAPTTVNRDNLLNEGFASDKIHITGNTSIDTLLLMQEILASKSDEYTRRFDQSLFERQMVLITGHRRENFGEKFEQICEAIVELAQHFPDYNFVYPVHLNPNVRDPVKRILRTDQLNNIHLLEPLSYDEFVFMMMKSTLVLTDSGGIQEEAPGLGKPVLVMRDTTERPEAIEAGTSMLLGTQKRDIVKGVSDLLTDQRLYSRMSSAINPYGDGTAAQIIARECAFFLRDNNA